MIIDDVIRNVERGKEGGNQGLYMGFPRLMEFVPGVQPSTIYNLGGMTGTAKTTFGMSSFVYNPYEDYVTRTANGEIIKLKVFLFSMEMSKETVISKGVCRRIFKDHGLLVDTNYILSRGKNRISQEIYDKVLETRKYFEEFEDVVTIYGSHNPTGIAKMLKSYFKENGKETRSPFTFKDDNGVEHNVSRFQKYTPNVETTYVIAIFDHVSLTKSESGKNVKQTIDKLIEYLVEYTNDYYLTPVIIQQLNRNVESTDRMKWNAIEPQLGDFRDSSDTTHAAHFVLGLTNPFMWEISPYRGYDITRLRDRFRSIKVLKSREGDANIVIGLNYVGESGVFRELPQAEPTNSMTEEEYTKIQNIKKYAS
jgi:replicative DNA helicase